MLLYVKNTYIFFGKKKIKEKVGGPTITIFGTLITFFSQQIIFKRNIFFMIYWERIITKIFCDENLPPDSQFTLISLYFLHFLSVFFVKKFNNF